MTDLKNLYQKETPQHSGWKAVIAATVMIVVLFALVGLCLQLLPAAIDQAFGIAAPTSCKMGLSGEHQYHPTTHQWIFQEGSK